MEWKRMLLDGHTEILSYDWVVPFARYWPRVGTNPFDAKSSWEFAFWMCQIFNPKLLQDH